MINLNKDYFFDYKLSSVLDQIELEAMKQGCKREIHVFNIQHKRPHAETDKENKILDWVNGATYARVFSRVLILAKLENRWLSITDMITTLGANDKTTRLNYQKARDAGVIEVPSDENKDPNRLLFRGNSDAVVFYKKYFDLVYSIDDQCLDDHLKFLRMRKELRNTLVTITK